MYRQCGIDGIQVFSSGAKSASGEKFLEDVASGEIEASEVAQRTAEQKLTEEQTPPDNVVDMAERRRRRQERRANVVELDTSRNRPNLEGMSTRELRVLARQAGNIEGWQRMRPEQLRQALQDNRP